MCTNASPFVIIPEYLILESAIMLKKASISIILFFTALVAFAQQDSIAAAQYMAQADACLGRNQVDSARIFHRAALDIFKKSDRLDWWLVSYINLSFSLADGLNQPFEAVELLDEALNQAWRQPKNQLEWEQIVRTQMYKGHFYQWYIL